MTVVAATGRDRGRNFLQPGVVLKGLFRTPWKQGLVESGMYGREDDVIWSAHKDVAFSSGVHTEEYHQFSFGSHFVFSYFRGNEDVGPTT